MFNRNKQRRRGRPAAAPPAPVVVASNAKPSTPAPNATPKSTSAKEAKRPAPEPGRTRKSAKSEKPEKSAGPRSRPPKAAKPAPDTRPKDAARPSGPPRPEADAGDGSKRKKRKVRTKNCVHCYTPNTVVHKVKLSQKSQWDYICDICWPTRCDGNPHYAYAGTWTAGRLVVPGAKKAAPAGGKKKKPRRKKAASTPPTG